MDIRMSKITLHIFFNNICVSSIYKATCMLCDWALTSLINLENFKSNKM